MVLEYAKIVFPFRTISFFALYILVNTVLYGRDQIAKDYIVSGTRISVLASPTLPSGMEKRLTDKIDSYPEYISYRNKIRDWAIAADVFIVVLFLCMVFGLLATHAHISFFIAMLHFIAVMLVTHMVCHKASVGYLISAIVIGVLVPSVIEIWNLLEIFVFKAYFYVSK